MTALVMGFQIRAQLLSAQSRAFLNSDAMLQEQSHVDAYHKPDIGSAPAWAIELVDTSILVLLKPHVSQFHVSLPLPESNAPGIRYHSAAPAAWFAGSVDSPACMPPVSISSKNVRLGIAYSS
jgi:hypothetical protein